MSVHAVTPELPDNVYQQAQCVAEDTHRPLAEVVREWIRPSIHVTLSELTHLPNDELLQVARETLPSAHINRLRELLATQRQRGLSADEQREAVALVEQEDFVTLLRRLSPAHIR